MYFLSLKKRAVSELKYYTSASEVVQLAYTPSVMRRTAQRR
jgi:hypothetical protein